VHRTSDREHDRELVSLLGPNEQLFCTTADEHRDEYSEAALILATVRSERTGPKDLLQLRYTCKRMLRSILVFAERSSGYATVWLLESRRCQMGSHVRCGHGLLWGAISV